MSQRKKRLLSIVIPAYKEEAGIADFHNKILSPELRKLTTKSLDFEIIYVNDGSPDNTLDKLEQIADSDNRVRVVNLSRNFGKEIALTAGIAQATGDATVMMDADGQHPPSSLSLFIDKWNEGAQVVVGVRQSNQKEGAIKRYGSKIFYSLFNRFSGAKLVPRSTDYRLITRDVRDEFLKFSERQRISRGIIDWLGFDRSYVEFDSPARLAGEASYTTKQLMKLAINSLVSLSLRPLHLLVWVGLAITTTALVAGIVILVFQLGLGDPFGWDITGSAMLGVFVAFLVGIVIVSEGIIAIYLSHIYEQAQARPLFVINKKGSRRLS